MSEKCDVPFNAEDVQPWILDEAFILFTCPVFRGKLVVIRSQEIDVGELVTGTDQMSASGCILATHRALERLDRPSNTNASLKA